jgi:hypothetical protein
LIDCGADVKRVAGEIPWRSAVEGLEGRARLAHALHGEVELALAVVVAADHRADGAVPWVDRDERGGGPLGVGQPLRDRVARRLLQLQVDRRDDAEPAAEDLGLAVLVDQLLLDVVDEVLRRPLRPRQADLVRVGEIGRVRLVVLRRRDLSLLEHRPQHEPAPLARLLRVGHRVVEARVGRDPREQRRLRERQVAGALLEVRQRGLLDPVGAVPEVDRVQVLLQDPPLRPAAPRVVGEPLELPGVGRLAHLARDCLLLAVERVLHELLRDRRAALDHGLAADVGDEGARDAAEVDALVLPEAAVLDRDDRVAHRGRDLVVLDERARLGAAQNGEHTRLRRVVDVAVDLLVELAARIELPGVDLGRDGANEAEAERHRPDEEEDGEEREEPKPADTATPTRGRFPTEQPHGPRF